MLFEWDDNKEKKNIIRHGIDFSTAALVFHDENRIEIFDDEHSADEGVYIMIIRKDIDLNTPLTAAQAEMLEALADRPVTPDEDCPELTPAQIAQFKQIAAVNREDRCKQTVTLRLSPQALRKA